MILDLFPGNPTAAVPGPDRARVRTEVAREFFLAAHGREPIDPRELAGQIAKDSRPRTVAGYDLTFSPVKSVSTLWAVADPAVAAAIERAHHAAVHDALTFIEEHALFTRTGPPHPAVRQHRSRASAGPTIRSLPAYLCGIGPGQVLTRPHQDHVATPATSVPHRMSASQVSV
jgi:hypothetical protein